MAYNGMFPMNYPAMQYPQMPMQAPQPQQQTQSNSIIWVSGEAGAKSYLVGPNQTVQLWDSEAQTIYLKSADASGMPTMKILDYTIREQAQPGANVPTLMQEASHDYVTKNDLMAFEERMKKQFVIRKQHREDNNE